MKSLIFIIILAMVALFFSACNDSSVTDAPINVSPSVVTVSNLQADGMGTGRSQFFSLKDSAIVSVADSASTKWDIAFFSTIIRVNCGASGPGNGGAIIMTGSSFDAITEAPASGYTIDSTRTTLAIKTGSGNGWYNYNFATNIVSPIPGNVIIVRTADRKYAKVEILSYYKDAPVAPGVNSVPRYYKFRYLYQGDGSRSFK